MRTVIIIVFGRIATHVVQRKLDGRRGPRLVRSRIGCDWGYGRRSVDGPLGGHKLLRLHGLAVNQQVDERAGVAQRMQRSRKDANFPVVTRNAAHGYRGMSSSREGYRYAPSRPLGQLTWFPSLWHNPAAASDCSPLSSR